MSFYRQFATTYERVFPFSQEVNSLLRRYLQPPPAAVLDIGCGTGTYSGALAEAGYDVTGIDLDSAMVDYARLHYPAAAFSTLNMLDVAALGRVFDVAFCIGNTAAHLTHDALAHFVADVRRVLVPGGAWVLQVMNWDYVLTQTAVTLPLLTGDGGVIFERHYRDISEDRVTFATRLVVEGTEVFSDATPLYPLRSGEIVALHTAQGFHLLAHYGSYSGAPFNPEQFSANVFVFQAPMLEQNPETHRS